MDYGPGWIDAWNHHVATWMTERDESNHSQSLYSSTMLNRRKEPIPLGEYRGSSMDWIPDTLFTGCYYNDDDEWSPKNDSYISKWMHLVDEDILAIFGEDGSRFNHKNSYRGFWPCLVLKRDIENIATNNTGGTYVVRIFHPTKSSVQTWWRDHGVPRFLTNFPRNSIRYFHKPYQSDLFWRGAFRHSIEIPDDLFPELWRDISENEVKNDESYNKAAVSNTSNIHECKFRPGDHIEVILDTDTSDWVGGFVDSWCSDPMFYSVSINDDESYNNIIDSRPSHKVSLMDIRWSRTKRLRSSNWHPFF